MIYIVLSQRSALAKWYTSSNELGQASMHLVLMQSTWTRVSSAIICAYNWPGVTFLAAKQLEALLYKGLAVYKALHSISNPFLSVIDSNMLHERSCTVARPACSQNEIQQSPSSTSSKAFARIFELKLMPQDSATLHKKSLPLQGEG